MLLLSFFIIFSVSTSVCADALFGTRVTHLVLIFSFKTCRTAYLLFAGDYWFLCTRKTTFVAYIGRVVFGSNCGIADDAWGAASWIALTLPGVGMSVHVALFCFRLGSWSFDSLASGPRCLLAMCRYIPHSKLLWIIEISASMGCASLHFFYSSIFEMLLNS